MPQRNEADEPISQFKLEGAPPPFYGGLTVLEARLHSDLAVSDARNFEFLRGAQSVPLTAEEIPAAQRDFPVVFAEGDEPTPVAALAARGADAFLTESGAWRPDVYQPAYLRRMPFILARIDGDSKRRALCADLKSPLFASDPDAPPERRLFADGRPTELAQRAIKICEEFDVAAARTSTLCRRLSDLGVFERRSVQVRTPGGVREFRGLVVISEAKLWELDDAALAGLARTGALNIAAAHLMSIANFRSPQAASTT